MDKQADAFRTISEAADQLGLPQHVLRFWETRFPQIKPLKRGGGRRYYRPDDVQLLAAIQRLLYGDGYTIKGVQRILKEQGAKAVVALGAREELGRLQEIGGREEPRGREEIAPSRAASGYGLFDTPPPAPAARPIAAAEASVHRRATPAVDCRDLEALLIVIDGCIDVLDNAGLS